MMKRKLLLFVVIIMISGISGILSCINMLAEEDFFGTWEGKSGETEMSFTFNSDGSCLLVIKDSATDEVVSYEGTFEIDLSKSPIPLSVTNIPNLNHGLYTIIRFTDDDSMTIAEFAPRWRLRPIAFTREESTVLKRVVP